MKAQPLIIQPWAAALAWDKRGDAGEGSPSCTCTLCGEVIGVAEDDPRWRNHDEDCAGCRMCEIAIRLFRGEGKACEQQRYHGDCFERILARTPTLGPEEKPPIPAETRVPLTYPRGGPLYWRDEVSGELSAAVHAFLGSTIPEPTPDQLRLVRDYILHWTKAPCWKFPDDMRSQLGELIQRIETAETRPELWTVLHELLNYGIDPL